MARIDHLLDALSLQVEVVAQLRPSHLVVRSPCPGWTVGDVLNHSLGVTQKLSDFAAGATEAPRTPPGDLLAHDPQLAVLTAAERARIAWAQADMTRLCHLPFATLSAEATIGLNLFDVLAHTWDITTAIGAQLDCDDELWVTALAAAKVVIGPDRDGAHYGPELAVTSSSTPRDRFLSFVGRADKAPARLPYSI